MQYDSNYKSDMIRKVHFTDGTNLLLDSSDNLIVGIESIGIWNSLNEGQIIPSVQVKTITYRNKK